MNNASKTWCFFKAYLKSMRLYYAFVTGIAGWIGVSFAAFTMGNPVALHKEITVLIILFLSWGINQIFNDFLGLKEDRVNAPHRPMVTGELHCKSALILSITLVTFSSIVTSYYSYWALIPFFCGVLLNVVYEYAKGLPVVGNIVFGLMISMCTLYGYLAVIDDFSEVFTKSRLSVLLLVIIYNGLMTYYTYFKDYQGDLQAGKKTLVVVQGLEKSRLTALWAALLPSIAFITIKSLGWIEATLTPTFIALFACTFILQIITGLSYFRHPMGDHTYYSLKCNFRMCACGQAMMIALFNQTLALILYILAYILIGVLFNFHKDSKA